MLAFRAQYVFPIDTPPLRDGIVAIDHDRIVAVGESSSPAMADILPAAIDVGHAAILPGLINSHTHLEFCDLREPLGTPGMAFTDWIRLVVRYRREGRPAEDPILRGIAESSSSGVTTLGEIASAPWASSAPLPLEVAQFFEVIGMRREAIDRYQAALNSVFSTSAPPTSAITWSDEFRPGISPHAPYSVHTELMKQCVQISAQRQIPLAHHLAESREELMLLRTGQGPFVQLLQDFEAWEPEAIPFGSRPLDYLRMLADAHRALVIHGNYLDDEELGFIAEHSARMTVVYCPRTHAFFEHDPYPLAKMMAEGVNVALGTDSRASNPDLSLLADLRFAAAQHPLVSPATLLRMITVNAANALGRADELGTITPGKAADLTMILLPKPDAADPHEALLDPACRVAATIFRGRPVFAEKDFFHFDESLGI